MWAYTRGRALVFITALEFSITHDVFSAVGSCYTAERSVYCGTRPAEQRKQAEREREKGPGGPPNRCVLFYVDVRVRVR